MMLEIDPTRAVIHNQGAKKVVSDSMGLVSFALRSNSGFCPSFARQPSEVLGKIRGNSNYSQLL